MRSGGLYEATQSQIGPVLAIHVCMADRRYPSHEDLRGILDRADEACREAEAVRKEVDASFRRRFCWPERPQSSVRDGLPYGGGSEG